MQTGSILEVNYLWILSVTQQIYSNICYDEIGHSPIKQTIIDVLERIFLEDMCQVF